MRQAILDIKAHAEAEGVEKGTLNVLTNLIAKGVLTAREAAEEAKMTVAEFCAKTGLTERS